MGRGTELYPDLGEHCQHEDCNQLDFLPFTCQGCKKVFCLEHRTYKAHSCSNAEHDSRVVVVCQNCSIAIEKKAGEDDKTVLDRHGKSGTCDPSKKKKPRCPVKGCRELLSLSNTSTCKHCSKKVCLKHRYSSEHDCSRNAVLLKARSGLDCRDKKGNPASPSFSVKVF